MKARFTDEQIIAMIKEQELVRRLLTCVGGTGSVRGPFANTNRSTAVWSHLMRSGLDLSRFDAAPLIALIAPKETDYAPLSDVSAFGTDLRFS